MRLAPQCIYSIFKYVYARLTSTLTRTLPVFYLGTMFTLSVWHIPYFHFFPFFVPFLYHYFCTWNHLVLRHPPCWALRLLLPVYSVMRVPMGLLVYHCSRGRRGCGEGVSVTLPVFIERLKQDKNVLSTTIACSNVLIQSNIMCKSMYVWLK